MTGATIMIIILLCAIFYSTIEIRNTLVRILIQLKKDKP